MTENLLDDSNQDKQVENYLNELVGEGKKFRTPEELARGKFESDRYIRTLEQQKDELRADYLKLREESMSKAKLEELIDQLEAKQKQTAAPTQNAPDVNIQKPQFDPNELKNFVRDELKTISLTERQEQNFNMVKTKLRERFGDNFATALKTQSDALGLTDQQVNQMAREAPAALLKAIGVDQQAVNNTFQAPPKSGLRNDSFSPVTQKRTWAYYQNIKKTDPKAYTSPKIQVQMHNDMIEQGDAFKDGDYNAL